MLIFVALVASASALDVWSGSNNAVFSGSGSVTGTNGIQFTDTAGGALSGGLLASVAIGGTTPGIALSDWSTSTTTIARTKTVATTPTTTHDQTIIFGGHVQAGIEKTSNNGAGTAIAEIIATTTPGTTGTDIGSAQIDSSLTMTGTSSGYAIADGTAGFASAQKSGSNDAFKITGSAIGKTDIRGYTTIVGTDDSATAALSSMTGAAIIKTSASASIAAASGISDSVVAVRDESSGHALFGHANATETVTGANANSMAWDGSSATVKTADNANALTDIQNIDINANQTTWLPTTGTTGTRDEADVENGLGAPTGETGSGVWASSTGGVAKTVVGTQVDSERHQVSSKKVTSEIFVNGGSYNAVNRLNELNEVSASGELGGTYPGVASGAHAVNVFTNPLSSHAILTQTASLTAATRTRAEFDTRTVGPGFTGNIKDDAGSYFSTQGFSTSSKSSAASTTVSTSVASGYEINWVNADEVSVSMYDAGRGLTSVGPVSSTVTETPDSAAHKTLETIVDTQP